MPSSFSELLNKRIAELALTPAEVRERLARQGAPIHANTLYLWTEGKSVPRRHHLAALLDVLGIVERQERAEAALLALADEGDTAAQAR